MKLIIDIPEETYNDIQSRDWKNGEFIFSEEWRAIHNGTPLEKHDEEVIKETVESIWGKPPYNEVLDKIRTEIDNALSDGMIHKKTVLGIIDMYRKEQE